LVGARPDRPHRGRFFIVRDRAAVTEPIENPER
jgi:hypothetical protein